MPDTIRTEPCVLNRSIIHDPPSMRFLFPLVLVLLSTTTPAPAQSLTDADALRLAEAFAVAEAIQDRIWPGWSSVPFAVLLVTSDHEYLIRHPRPTDDFRLVTAYDSLLESAVYVRDRQFAPTLLATFPAVNGLPTVVVGVPERAGKSSTEWVITLLHEHFHQLQMGHPAYWPDVAGLELSGGDESGIWMLNYPFPYDDPQVGERFETYKRALLDALSESVSDARLAAFDAAREDLVDVLDEDDFRYLSFQLWQEGIARYTELRAAGAAAEQSAGWAAFRRFDDFVPYSYLADSLHSALLDELDAVTLSEHGRIAFYSVGAAEGLLLDARRPDWRSLYFEEPFFLERYSTE